MKKLVISIFIMVGLTFVFTQVNRADTVDFAVTATVPAATGVSIVATEIDSVSNEFGQQVSALNFDPLTFDSTNGIYLPDHYFAIDVGTVGGAGSPNVNVTYVEGSKPVDQDKGLGWKSIATFVKITGSPGNEVQTDLTAHGPKKLLKDLTGEVITDTELSGGFLRLFVGVFPGDDQEILDVGGEVFSNADEAGIYSGTLTVSATVT